MDDLRFGATIRAVRVRRRLTQRQVADRAGASQPTVSRVEHGDAARLSLDTLRTICRVLDVRVDLEPRWRGPGLARLLDARHAEMQQAAVRLLSGAGWVAVPEVTFSQFGERGSIDVLGWDRDHRAALVVELKSALVDLQDLLASLDRKRRLAPGICRDRGWPAQCVGACIVIADTRANRRRVAAHVTLLRTAYPDDGHVLRRWLAEPTGTLAALTDLSGPGSPAGASHSA